MYIKATPQAIWDAITKPEWTERYGYGGRSSTTCGRAARTARSPSEEMKRRGRDGGPMPDVVVDGEVIEADPPRRLVQTWRMLMDRDDGRGLHPPHVRDRRERRAASAS